MGTQWMMMEERGFEGHQTTIYRWVQSYARNWRSSSAGMLDLKSARTAYATPEGIEVMRMIRRLQCILLRPGVAAEARFFNKLFRVYS
jgi:transposase-like protein